MARGRSAGQDAPAYRHAALGLDPGVAAGEIDRDIDALLAAGHPDRLGKFRRLDVVDDVVGAELGKLAALFRATGAGEDFRARHLGELHAGDADAAAGA